MFCSWMGREAISDKWVRLLPVTYALFSGMVGTQSVLFCKTLSTLLRTTIAGPTSLWVQGLGLRLGWIITRFTHPRMIKFEGIWSTLSIGL